eukprot:gene993-5634_t
MLGNVGDLAGASAGYGSSSSAQAALSPSFERLPSSLSPAAFAKLNNDGEGDTVNVLDCYGKKHFVNGNPVRAHTKMTSTTWNPTPMACENPLNCKSCREKAFLSSLVGEGAGRAALKLVATVKQKFSWAHKKTTTTNNN